MPVGGMRMFQLAFLFGEPANYYGNKENQNSKCCIITEQTLPVIPGNNFFNLKNTNKKDKNSYPIIKHPKSSPSCSMKIISANMKLTSNSNYIPYVNIQHILYFPYDILKDILGEPREDFKINIQVSYKDLPAGCYDETIKYYDN